MTITTAAPRSSRTRRGLRLLGLLVVLSLATAALVWHGLQSPDLHHVHLVIDGGEVAQAAVFSDLRPGQQVLAVLAIAAACLALMLVVPLLLLAVGIASLTILLLALGLPLLAVLSVAALLVAPLALFGLLCWWLIRALLRDGKTSPSATMT